MRVLAHPQVDRESASRALIDLVASVAWAERQHPAGGQLDRVREEAMTLLPRVQRGDQIAARRAMELASMAGARPA
ncbi:MAG: hypothetical protein M3Z65_04100 [Chloroflexota bacterium]|nr:hypothetical protein [Chloroflexota bacterium]